MEELGNRCSFRVKKFVRKQEIFVSIPSSLIIKSVENSVT